jgi:hypothetical protein
LWPCHHDDSWEKADDATPVLLSISGADLAFLLLLDNLQNRGSAGTGMERCEVKGNGLSVGLHINNPAEECCKQL